MAVAYECDRLFFWAQVSLSSCYFGAIFFFGCGILVSDIDNEASRSCCLWRGGAHGPDLPAAGPELCPLEPSISILFCVQNFC